MDKLLMSYEGTVLLKNVGNKGRKGLIEVARKGLQLKLNVTYERLHNVVIISNIEKIKYYKREKGIDAVLDLAIKSIKIEDKLKSTVKYKITYEHLIDDLEGNLVDFTAVRNASNKHGIELTNKDFQLLMRLSAKHENIDWIIERMSTTNLSLLDVLVDYMEY